MPGAESRTREGSPSTRTWFNPAALFPGLLLVVAAALKGQQIITDETAVDPVFHSRFLLVLTTEVELIVGACLLAGPGAANQHYQTVN